MPDEGTTSYELDALPSWLAENPDFDPLHADLVAEGPLERLNWPNGSSEELLPTVRAYQRVYRVAQTHVQAFGLLQMGFASASQIARVPRSTFVGSCAELLGSEQDADEVHRRATRIAEKVTHVWATLSANVASPTARALRTNTAAPALETAFQPLPSYEEFFGSLNYYDCSECNSIFSASAYLVELLKIIDERITKPNQSTIPSGLTFEERRPDIAKIKLTCENTNTMIPYLKIVDERLVETALKQLKLESEDALWKALSSEPYPFELPQNVLLLEIRTLLASIEVKLADIYAAWEQPAAQVARESLGLSPAQLSIVITPEASDEAKLASYYGVTASELNGLALVDTFVKQTGIGVNELNLLVYQDLTEAEVAEGISTTFFINRGTAAEKIYLQIAEGKEASTIEHLNNDSLDRTNRFLRLAKVLAWSYTELDWAMHAVSGGQPELDEQNAAAVVEGLAQLSALAAKLEVGLLDACSLAIQLKTYGSAGAPTQFDRVYNAPGQRNGQPFYHPEGDAYNPSYKSKPIEWTIAATDEANQATAGWLAGALALSVNALRELAKDLFPEATVKLDVEALSALRRHALLVSKLGIPVAQYLILLSATGLSGARTLTTSQALALVEQGKWLGSAPIDAYTLEYVLNGVSSPYVDPLYEASSISSWLQSLWGLTANLESEAAREEQLIAQLAILFGGCENAQVEAAMNLAGACVTLPAALKSWQEAFQAPPAGTGKSPYQGTVEELAAWGSRWLVLAQGFSLPNNLLESLLAHPATYGFTPAVKDITLSGVRSLQSFQGYTLSFQDTTGGLVSFANARAEGEPAQAQAKALSAVSGWNEAQTLSLLDTIAKEVTEAPAVIVMLDNCFELSAKLGADTTYTGALAGLAVLEESQWSSYEAFASSVRNQVSSLYDTETWEINAAHLQGEIQAQRRDALLGLVQWNLGKTYSDITSPEGVYQFMLIEVQTGAAVEISYIVEATNAAQLYLQRCRLLLERGIQNLDIPEPWWEWIMNYRTWQANREVFLYPENYMVPSVRRNRTNLFKELENELQQSQITEDYVAEAYEGYFAGFNDLAKLKPVNSYHCKVNGPDGEVDTLFLFARTETSPPTFYYCSRENEGAWTEWAEIEVSINADFITPVYAFNRLFVFWAELKSSTESTVSTNGDTTQTANSITWKQSIFYSFLGHGGKWVTPQTLVGERVVNYEPPSGKTVPGADPFASLLDMSEPSWQRVYVVKTGKGNLVYGENTPVDYETISVFCGPFLQQYPTTPYPLTPDAEGENQEETEFIQGIYERTVDLNSLILGRLKGQLSVTAPVSMDINLQSNFVLCRDEFTILSYANTSTNPTISADVDSVEDLLQIVPSNNVIYDNYFGDVGEGYARPQQPEPVTAGELRAVGFEESLAQQILAELKKAKLLDESNFVIQPFNSNTDIATALAGLGLSPVQLEEVRSVMLASLGTMIPLQNISPVNGRLITVKNQPGWFQFDNGDESFLLTLPARSEGAGKETPVFQTIDEAHQARRPTVSRSSFEVAEISESQAKQIDVLLTNYHVINAQGNVVYDLAEEVIDEKELNIILMGVEPKLTTHQMTVVGNILLNTPFASKYTFMSSGIDEQTAEAIVKEFQTYEVIDVTGRVTMHLVTGSAVETLLGNMVLKKEITEEQVPGIYRDLMELTAPTEFAYSNSGQSQLTSLWDYVFEVTRTSTGAVDRLSRTLFAQGVPGLLALASQQAPVVSVLPFERFSPSPYNLKWPKLLDGAQVDFEGVYGLYYWEVFYFIPMLVANSLTINQQFESAENWFRYVLNPTAPEEFVYSKTFHELSEDTVSTPESEKIFEELKAHAIGTPPAPILGTPSDGNPQQGVVNPQFTSETDLSFLLAGKVQPSTESVVRNVLLNYQTATPADHYWQFQPFRNASLETLRETLSDENPAIYVYENDPYDPFAIGSLRIGAFEKTTLMQYVENLISWGDSLFMQESFETTTAATMLYVYALDLLGERPVDLGPGPAREAMDFAEIKEKYPDGIPTFLIEVENTLPPPNAYAPAVEEGGTPYNDLNTYFCVPDNEKLLNYWTTLEDRLYKIRHSMNIEGEVRQLPLFAPPINPLELVRAGASGNGYLPASKGSAAAIPAYRFEAMLTRARNVTAQVVEFGGKLLGALERQDGESLELLRSTQERSVLEMMTSVKQDAIDEAEGTLASLRESLAGAKNRASAYQTLISDGLNESETTNLEAMAAGLVFSMLASGFRAAAAIAYTIPQVGSPFAMTYGGVQVGSSMTAASAGAEIGADISNFIAQRSLTMAGYQRREQDWKLSLQNANYEAASLEKQIQAAEAHLASARQELSVNKTEIEQNKQVYEYLKDKFTNVDLYQWMVGRISAVYFQAYKLALELALATQECYRFELGTEESFLSFDYWDNLHRGLMAGENLSFSLSQMESAYVAKNTRRLEIERTVSLALWDPNALWELRNTGKCTFDLSEQLFDYDYPGQYNRQIKNITISIPAVIGPYENFKATLKQTYSAVATSTEEAALKYMLEKTGQPPSGVRENWAPRQQIAISRGVEDSGVFQLDFRDERYLPFEGTGAVSKWELQLPQSTNRFDLDAISDVVITVRYTAQEGGTPYAQTVEKLLRSHPLPGAIYLSLAQAYSAQWNAFMAEHPSEETQTLQFEVKEGSLAYLKSATLTDVFVRLETGEVAIPSKVEFLSASIDGAPAQEFQFTAEEVGNISGLTLSESKFIGAWKLVFDLKQMRENSKLKQLLDAEQKYLDPTKLLNAELILSYEGSVF